MARTVTLASLQAQVRQRADMLASSFVTDDELAEYINQSVAELYDLLVQTDEDFYTRGLEQTVTTPAIALPADFYKLRGVDARVSGNEFRALERVEFGERNDVAWSGQPFSTGPTGHRVLNDSLVFLPVGSPPFYMRLWYVPVPPRLNSAGTITFDGNAGWEEYAVVDAAIKCLQKEESDVSVLMAQKEAMRQRVLAHASRDISGPRRIARTRGRGARQFRGW